MTGGQAEIQDIQPYTDSNEIDRMDSMYEIEYIDERNAKDFKDVSRAKRSVLDVVITYPTNSIVDINDITSKLVKERNTSAPFIPINLSTTESPEKMVNIFKKFTNTALKILF